MNKIQYKSYPQYSQTKPINPYPDQFDKNFKAEIFQIINTGNLVTINEFFFNKFIPDIIDDDTGDNLIMKVLLLDDSKFNENIKLNIVKFLFDDHNISITHTNNIGDSPLHLAAKKQYLSIVKYILKVNPDDINTQNMYGKTPLHLAAEANIIECPNTVIEDKINIISINREKLLVNQLNNEILKIFKENNDKDQMFYNMIKDLIDKYINNFLKKTFDYINHERYNNPIVEYENINTKLKYKPLKINTIINNLLNDISITLQNGQNHNQQQLTIINSAINEIVNELENFYPKAVQPLEFNTNINTNNIQTDTDIINELLKFDFSNITGGLLFSNNYLSNFDNIKLLENKIYTDLQKEYNVTQQIMFNNVYNVCGLEPSKLITNIYSNIKHGRSLLRIMTMMFNWLYRSNYKNNDNMWLFKHRAKVISPGEFNNSIKLDIDPKLTNETDLLNLTTQLNNEIKEIFNKLIEVKDPLRTNDDILYDYFRLLYMLQTWRNDKKLNINENDLNSIFNKNTQIPTLYDNFYDLNADISNPPNIDPNPISKQDNITSKVKYYYNNIILDESYLALIKKNINDITLKKDIYNFNPNTNKIKVKLFDINNTYTSTGDKFDIENLSNKFHTAVGNLRILPYGNNNKNFSNYSQLLNTSANINTLNEIGKFGLLPFASFRRKFEIDIHIKQRLNQYNRVPDFREINRFIIEKDDNNHPYIPFGTPQFLLVDPDLNNKFNYTLDNLDDFEKIRLFTKLNRSKYLVSGNIGLDPTNRRYYHEYDIIESPILHSEEIGIFNLVTNSTNGNFNDIFNNEVNFEYNMNYKYILAQSGSLLNKTYSVKLDTTKPNGNSYNGMFFDEILQPDGTYFKFTEPIKHNTFFTFINSETLNPISSLLPDETNYSKYLTKQYANYNNIFNDLFSITDNLLKYIKPNLTNYGNLCDNVYQYNLITNNIYYNLDKFTSNNLITDITAYLHKVAKTFDHHTNTTIFSDMVFQLNSNLIDDWNNLILLKNGMVDNYNEQLNKQIKNVISLENQLSSINKLLKLLDPTYEIKNGIYNTHLRVPIAHIQTNTNFNNTQINTYSIDNINNLTIKLGIDENDDVSKLIFYAKDIVPSFVPGKPMIPSILTTKYKNYYNLIAPTVNNRLITVKDLLNNIFDNTTVQNSPNPSYIHAVDIDSTTLNNKIYLTINNSSDRALDTLNFTKIELINSLLKNFTNTSFYYNNFKPIYDIVENHLRNLNVDTNDNMLKKSVFLYLAKILDSNIINHIKNKLYSITTYYVRAIFNENLPLVSYTNFNIIFNDLIKESKHKVTDIDSFINTDFMNNVLDNSTPGIITMRNYTNSLSNPDIIKLLVYYNELGNTLEPLNNRKCISNNYNIIDLLLDINSTQNNDIKGWSPIYYIINSSNYVLLEKYLSKFQNVSYETNPLYSLDTNKKLNPIQLIINNLSKNYNNLLDVRENLIPTMIVELKSFAIVPKDFDNFIKIVFKIVFNKDNYNINLDQNKYLNVNTYISNIIKNDYNVMTELENTRSKINFNNINNFLKELNTNLENNYYDSDNIYKIKTELTNILTTLPNYSNILSYIETKFNIKSKFDINVNNFYKNLIIEHSLVIFYMFINIYYPIVKKIMKDTITEKNIIIDTLYNELFDSQKGTITNLLTELKYDTDDEIYNIDPLTLKTNIRKENLLIRLVRTQLKIKSNKSQPDIITEDISNIIELINNKILMSGQFNDKTMFLSNINIFNGHFIKLIKAYFNYSTILQDNIIRSIGNIFQSLKTIQIIVNFMK